LHNQISLSGSLCSLEPPRPTGWRDPPRRVVGEEVAEHRRRERWGAHKGRGEDYRRPKAEDMPQLRHLARLDAGQGAAMTDEHPPHEGERKPGGSYDLTTTRMANCDGFPATGAGFVRALTPAKSAPI
jgi:hypothetical protein